MTCHWLGTGASIHRIGASGIVSDHQQQPPPHIMRLDDRLGDVRTDLVISDDDGGFITAQD